MRYSTLTRLAASLVVAAALTPACTDVTAPPRRPASELREAPSSVVVAGKTLVLETYLWRNFAPVIPQSGAPLTAVLRVKTADRSPVPASITADGAWVVFGDDVWATAVAQEYPDERSYEVVARNGPQWTPGVSVDVVIRLRHGGETIRLRAAAQRIHRVD